MSGLDEEDTRRGDRRATAPGSDPMSHDDDTRSTVRRMGTLYYGAQDTPIHIEDRALAHLKVVIATKLRRNESFTLSWHHPDEEPRGRSTIWLHPSIPLMFVFDDPEPPELSRAWIEKLAHSANTSGGILLVDELLADPDLDSSRDEG